MHALMRDLEWPGENKRGRRCLLPDGGRFQKLRGSLKDLTDLKRSKNLYVEMYVEKGMYVGLCGYFLELNRWYHCNAPDLKTGAPTSDASISVQYLQRFEGLRQLPISPCLYVVCTFKQIWGFSEPSSSASHNLIFLSDTPFGQGQHYFLIEVPSPQ